MKRILLLGVALQICTQSADAGDKGPAKAGVVVKKDVVYGNVHGAGLLADIAYPEGKGPFPVILSVHGGRWVGSHRSDPGEGAIDVKQWAGFGLFAMSIDYRLVGCSPPPACYQDVQCAIRWVHAHKDKYPIDADRVFLMGMSAGGHLVSLAATLGDGPFGRTGGWAKDSNAICGVISLSGPYDLEKLSWGNLWKPASGLQPAARRLASPIQHVSAKSTPMLILHSDNDGSVPIEQAIEMADALKKAKARHRLSIHKKKGHMRITEEVFKESLAFIEEFGKDVEGPNHRKPKDDADLRYWLENMVWHHQFTKAEIAAATGLSPLSIEAALRKFDISAASGKRPRRPADAPLLVVPYPGGRHPRIGFLEGAVRPQRETKVSVFTPWDDASYVVVDVPEAIFTNLGLTYLAHTHVPTIWEKQKVELDKLEWNRRPDGTLDIERRLPNGITFGTKIVPNRTEVRMELWLKNGTKEKLTDMRVQNCVLLKGAKGFEAQSNDNKVFAPPYAACKSADGKRWVITAWDPIQRAWANAKCPCLHSDPFIPDCAPGETQRLRGWLSFYKGDDIQAELRRIDKMGWRAK